MYIFIFSKFIVIRFSHILCSKSRSIFVLEFFCTKIVATNIIYIFFGCIIHYRMKIIYRIEHKVIDAMRVAMLRLVLNSGNKHDYAFKVVYKKYSHSRYGRISESFLERATRVSVIESLFNT